MPPEKSTPSFYIVMAVVLGLLTLLLLFIVLLTVVYSRRKNKLLLQNQLLNEELSKAELEVREQALKDVSLEIHDNIGQLLTLVSMNLYRINGGSETEERHIADARRLVHQSVEELRSMSRRLQGADILRQGLLEAVKQLAAWAHRSGDCRVHFVLTGEADFFPPDDRKNLIIYRMVQELLNNALKHAGAGHITIEAALQPGILHLTVADDGNGFDASAATAGSSLGMTTLKKRAALLKASLNIQTAPGRGTRVVIAVPV